MAAREGPGESQLGQSWQQGQLKQLEKNPSSDSMFFWIFPITIQFPYALSPQQSPRCCPCPWVLFPFCSIPTPLDYQFEKDNPDLL